MFARWTQRLNEFDFTFEHRPGNTNEDADELSRFQVLLALEDQVYSEVNQAYVSNEEIENYVTDKEFPSRIPSSHRDKLIKKAFIHQYHERAHEATSKVVKNLQLDSAWNKRRRRRGGLELP